MGSAREGVPGGSAVNQSAGGNTSPRGYKQEEAVQEVQRMCWRVSVGSNEACGGFCRSAVSPLSPDWWKPGPELFPCPGRSRAGGFVRGVPPGGPALPLRHHRRQPGCGREVHVPLRVGVCLSVPLCPRLQRLQAAALCFSKSCQPPLGSCTANFHLKPMTPFKLSTGDDPTVGRIIPASSAIVVV